MFLGFYNEWRRVNRALKFNKHVRTTGRVKASPWDYCIGDLRRRGGSGCCCIDHPKILLPSQRGDVQILIAKEDGGSAVTADGGGWRQRALHSGRGVRRGSFGISPQLGGCWTACKGVYWRWILCFRAPATVYFIIGYVQIISNISHLIRKRLKIHIAISNSPCRLQMHRLLPAVRNFKI